jgi:hypothetical protein
MIRELYALLLAGTLLIPMITSVRGDDRSGAASVLRTDPSRESAWKSLSLPPVLHVDMMPWLGTGAATTKGLKVDTLFWPKPNLLGPFWLPPPIPDTQGSLTAESLGVGVKAE